MCKPGVCHKVHSHKITILSISYKGTFRFGTFLGLAHAAMTAEGDNSVLMQKVAKEHLAFLSKNPPKVEKPTSTSVSDPGDIFLLFFYFFLLLTSWSSVIC